MPATVIAERIGWSGSISWLRERVRMIRPEYAPADPADRLGHDPGQVVQCDLWFPPASIPLGDGQSGSPPVLVMVAWGVWGPAGCSGWVVWGSGAGSCGGVVRARLSGFECSCVSVGFGIRLVFSWFRGLCTVLFSSTPNAVVVVQVSVFRVFGLFCGLVDGGV